MKNKKAVVLLSGGLDSATTAYIAKEQGYDVFCLSFDYGQRHKKELQSAVKIAEKSGFKYEIVKFTMPWGGSSLTDIGMDIPKSRSLDEIGVDIPSTYVPARNTIFLSFGVSYAEAIGAEAVFIGANAVDFSGYPDCRPLYFKKYQEMIAHGTKHGKIKIEVPLLEKTKADIIKIGMILGVPHDLTWSCYEGGEAPCEICDSCLIRAKGFKDVGYEYSKT